MVLPTPELRRLVQVADPLLSTPTASRVGRSMFDRRRGHPRRGQAPREATSRSAPTLESEELAAAIRQLIDKLREALASSDYLRRSRHQRRPPSDSDPSAS